MRLSTWDRDLLKHASSGFLRDLQNNFPNFKLLKIFFYMKDFSSWFLNGLNRGQIVFNDPFFIS